MIMHLCQRDQSNGDNNMSAVECDMREACVNAQLYLERCGKRVRILNRRVDLI